MKSITRFDLVKGNGDEIISYIVSWVLVSLFIPFIPFVIHDFNYAIPHMLPMVWGIVMLWTLCLIWSYTSQLAKDHRKALEDLAEEKRLRQRAEQPRLVPFKIEDKKLAPPSADGKKYVLIGQLLVHLNGRVTAAPEHLVHLQTKPYEREVHDPLIKAPFYQTRGLDPRNGDRLLEMSGGFYTY